MNIDNEHEVKRQIYEKLRAKMNEPGRLYPLPGPAEVRSLLLPLATALGTDFGKEARRRGVLVTAEMAEVVSAAVVAAVTCGAHLALHKREALLQHPEVQVWAAWPERKG